METQQKTATINNEFPDIDSQRVEDRQNKKSRILFIIVSLIIVLLLCGGVFAYHPIKSLVRDFQCRELSNSIQIEDSNINYNCQTNTDCIRNEKGMGCMHCINKNTNEKYLELINETYSKGVKKGCFPQLTCRQSTCQCINNKCEGVEIMLTPTSTPTINPTANWKTYTGNNILISYPSSWELVVPSNTTDNSDYVFITNNKNTSPNYSEVVINGPLWGPYGVDKDYQTQVSDYVNYYLSSTSDLGNYRPEIVGFKDINANNLKGKVYSITMKDSLYSGDGKIPFYSTKWVFIPDKNNSDRFYHIRLNGSDPLLDQILSTFKFLDKPMLTPNFQSLCESAAGGKWLANYNECERINAQQCSQLLNGTYNNCASACRHDPKYPNVNCIEVCVPVCVVNI